MGILWIPGLSTAQENCFPGSWQRHFMAQDHPPSWGCSIRGIGRGATGVHRMHDPSEAGSASEELSSFLRGVQEQQKHYDLVIPVGGLGSARDPGQVRDFMKMIERDSGTRWKETVASQTADVALLPKSTGKIYWQIGNEVNSRHYSETLQPWTGRSGPPRPDDLSTLPYYVEYFLAPTLEAIRKVGREHTGDPEGIPVILGTLAGAARAKSRQWLDQLLNYRIRGDYAKTLAGRPVYELVDIVGIHYLVTTSGGEWQGKLDGLYTRWVGKGRIQGIWATEEIGRKRAQRGLGAALTLKVAARYLHWWNSRSISPAQGRCSFWGWRKGPPGTTGAEGIQTLSQWLTGTGLLDISAAVKMESPHDLEAYAFETPETERIAAVVFPVAEDSPASLRNFSLHFPDRLVSPDAELHLFSPSGHHVQQVRLSREKDHVMMSDPLPLSLENQTLLLLIRSQGKPAGTNPAIQSGNHDKALAGHETEENF